MRNQYADASPDDLKTEWKRINDETGGVGGHKKTRELKHLVGCLLDGETVEALSDATVSNKSCLVVVTAERLLVIRSKSLSGVDETEVGLADIVGVNVKTGMILAKITVKTNHEEILIENLSKPAAHYITQKIRAGKQQGSRLGEMQSAPAIANPESQPRDHGRSHVSAEKSTPGFFGNLWTGIKITLAIAIIGGLLFAFFPLAGAIVMGILAIGFLSAIFKPAVNILSEESGATSRLVSIPGAFAATILALASVSGYYQSDEIETTTAESNTNASEKTVEEVEPPAAVAERPINDQSDGESAQPLSVSFENYEESGEKGGNLRVENSASTTFEQCSIALGDSGTRDRWYLANPTVLDAEGYRSYPTFLFRDRKGEAPPTPAQVVSADIECEQPKLNASLELSAVVGKSSGTEEQPEKNTAKSKVFPAAEDRYKLSQDNQKIAWMQRGMKHVKSRLRDPDSAEFQNIYFHRGSSKAPITCGEVNSKNGFGGYSGFQKFVSAGKAELTFLEQDVADFYDLWDRLCIK